MPAGPQYNSTQMMSVYLTQRITGLQSQLAYLMLEDPPQAAEIASVNAAIAQAQAVLNSLGQVT